MQLYFKLLRANFRVLCTFKSDFMIGVISTTFEQILSLLFIEIIFSNFYSIGSYSRFEIILIFGVLSMALAMQKTFFDNIWNISYTYVRFGELDRLLVKPQNVLLQIICEKINISGFFNQVFALLIILYALHNLNITINIFVIIAIFVIGLITGIILASIALIFASLSFWVVDATPIISSVFSLIEFAKYPINLFSQSIMIILTFIIPFGFAGYYPATIFLGNYQMIIILLVVMMFWASLAIYIWQRGLKNYTGISS